MRQAATSLEYVKVKVTAVVAGADYNPTGDTVQMAFLPLSAGDADPASGDWKTASWETISGRYYARCLVGPGGTVTLSTNGDGSEQVYVAWVKISDNPEIPVKRAGTVTIF